MTGDDAVNDLDTPTGERERKAYFTLAARYAIAGLELVKGDWEVTGQAPYYATRYGLFKPLENLEAAQSALPAAERDAPLILVLDGVTDPHNLGACLRVADGAGVHAVIAPKDHEIGRAHV